jgi:hypothetical protein
MSFLQKIQDYYALDLYILANYYNLFMLKKNLGEIKLKNSNFSIQGLLINKTIKYINN